MTACKIKKFPTRLAYPALHIALLVSPSIMAFPYPCHFCRAKSVVGLSPEIPRIPALFASSQPGQESQTAAPLFKRTFQELRLALQIAAVSLTASLLLISWEDVSMAHPMRQEMARSQSSTTQQSSWGQSTVRGMAFGRPQRLAIARTGLEANDYQDLFSYNEVMLQHRTERVSQWNGNRQDDLTQDDVLAAVHNIQLAVLKLQDCKQMTKDYEWDKLEAILSDHTFRSNLDSSCYLLQKADRFLSLEAREVVGFDWGSCAWRHCGALADAQEAMDEIEHLLGVLEPFECLFCLDIIERSLRDILDVTTSYQNLELQHQIPAYVPLQRMSDLNDDNLDGFDEDFLDTLRVLRSTDT
jgi:hypothetical protein